MEFLFKHLGALRIFRILRSCSLLVLLLLQTLLFSGCGENKPKALNNIENAAAKKAESMENFAKDRLKVGE